MTMSNRSAPPRASTSSTARAPAMPFPTTTSFCFGIRFVPCVDRLAPCSDLQQSDVQHEMPARAGGRGEHHLELGFGKKILDHGERNVLAAFRADRKIAHRLSV